MELKFTSYKLQNKLFFVFFISFILYVGCVQSDIEENKSTSEKALKVKRSADQDIESELTKIKELFEKGLITQEVYETKQKEILGLN